MLKTFAIALLATAMSVGLSAGLAQAKGRSGLVWWLVSLLLGPLATFFIVVLPPTPPTSFPRE